MPITLGIHPVLRRVPASLAWPLGVSPPLEAYDTIHQTSVRLEYSELEHMKALHRCALVPMV